MDYTNSANYATHAGTGKRMHEANQALPTVVSDADVNQLTWELMSVIESAGLVGTPFNENSPASYQQLLLALKLLTGGRAVDSGVANSYILTMTPAPAALIDMMLVSFTVNATNTGASTINLNGLGSKAIQGFAQVALQGGELLAGGKATVIYSTSRNAWVLIGCSGAPKQVADGTKSQHALARGQSRHTSNDASYADNSDLPASTNWVRNALSAIASAAGFVFSYGASNSAGYIKLPSWLGGFIAQWGSLSFFASDGLTGTLNTFPVAFPSACFLVVGSDYGASNVAADCMPFSTGNYSGPNFRAWARDRSGVFVNVTGRYIAVGR